MDAGSIKKILSLYEGRLDRFGIDVKTVGWRDRVQQALRFKVLAEVGLEPGSSVCDVGCGLGDMYAFFKKKRQYASLHYSGIDISRRFIEVASRRFPAGDFQATDILSRNYREQKDYFLVSGMFNIRVKNNREWVQASLKKMFRLCRKAVAVNFTSSHVDYENPLNFHYSPEDIFSTCKTLTRFATLRHDYPLWEFTVYLHKR